MSICPGGSTFCVSAHPQSAVSLGATAGTQRVWSRMGSEGAVLCQLQERQISLYLHAAPF